MPWLVKVKSQNHTESQKGRGWKGPLGVTESQNCRGWKRPLWII